MKLYASLTSLLLTFGCAERASARRPNIVFIFTDDQDYQHGSLDHMPALQEHLVTQGTLFTNHYATVAVCCPSRVSLMRGQAAHNTNITNVAAPGGGYAKWLASAEDGEYLPHWLHSAGYQAEYIGKLYNGHSLLNWSPAPRGWDNIDILLDPYTNEHNSVVMAQNGHTPKYYEGWQQSDVVRVKALDRLQHLTAEADHDPFFLMVAPTAPHVQPGAQPPAPPSRYVDHFARLSLPVRPNFNPPDEQHQDRPAWWGGLPRLNSTQLAEVNLLYRRRSESLLGVDDIIADVVAFLEGKGELENTFIIFSSDQGYHLGTHRDIGKCSPYIEDANIPLVVRGPGVPKGATSAQPSTVIDFAPTFLDIAGLAEEARPPFFDGRSMLSSWRNPEGERLDNVNEAINVEFWGRAYTELPTWTDGDGAPRVYKNNTYKTMRIVGEDYAWVFSVWCTGDIELYDSKNDPFELENLAGSHSEDLKRVQSRLNALLMVTKSCEGEICRNPWSVLQPSRHPDLQQEAFATGEAGTITNFADALNPVYDTFFASVPSVRISECEQYQYSPNERPFYPPSAEQGLGLAHRSAPTFFEYPDVKPLAKVPYKVGGSWEQREIRELAGLMKDARDLTGKELGQDWRGTTCNEGVPCVDDPREIVERFRQLGEARRENAKSSEGGFRTEL